MQGGCWFVCFGWLAIVYLPYATGDIMQVLAERIEFDEWLAQIMNEQQEDAE